MTLHHEAGRLQPSCFLPWHGRPHPLAQSLHTECLQFRVGAAYLLLPGGPIVLHHPQLRLQLSLLVPHLYSTVQ